VQAKGQQNENDKKIHGQVKKRTGRLSVVGALDDQKWMGVMKSVCERNQAEADAMAADDAGVTAADETAGRCALLRVPRPAASSLTSAKRITRLF